MKARADNGVLTCLLCSVIIFASGEINTSRAVATSVTPVSAQPGYSATSWALGAVVPDGAPLSGGSKLDWGTVSNVTALTELPSIKQPDMPVYVVLSLMVADSSVLQVAVGVYRHSSLWTTFADLVTNAGSVAPAYLQVLNSSGPQILPGSSVSISILHSLAGPWSLRVADAGTGGYVEQQFPSSVTTAPKAGDQEVFALESYSRNVTTFEGMGNLSLGALFVDGSRVSGGVYAYSDWGPGRQPLFAVGSASSTVPAFISVQGDKDGSVIWHFVSPWAGNRQAPPSFSEEALMILIVAGSVASLVVIGGLIRAMERGRGSMEARV